MLAKKVNIITYCYKIFVYQCNSLLIDKALCIKFVVKSKLNCMKKVLKISVICMSVLLLLALTIVGGFFVYINTSKRGTSFDKELLQEANTTIDIYDTQNNKINAHIGKKALVKYDELPAYVKNAFVSIEDKDFYKHNGLNYKRIAKAFLNNLKSRSLKEGASTISQQLIKNTHLTSEKTFARKLNEMSLALELERNFTKDEILETYLNVIYFGNGAYGLENASEMYFGKPADKLTVAQSATLAGMIKSPKTYSPIYNQSACLDRRNLVLREMKRDNVITQEQFENAINEKILLEQNKKSNIRNFYEEATLLEASKILGLNEREIALGGYKIFTYQEPADQQSLHNTINNDEYYHKNSFGNIADSCAVVIDNTNGGITAFDGRSVYDIANMKRSPGSSIKPILVYAPALECGKISPCTPILDEETSFADYKPQNVGAKYYGWIDATTTIEKSLNIPAIKIMQATGIETCKNVAKNCGITFDQNDNNLALALGALTNGTTVVELANTYLPFANNGKFVAAKFVKKICNKNGNVVYENQQQAKQTMSPETAYLMTNMLKSGVKKGTSSRLNGLGLNLAGKTGTVGIKGTNLNSDVWSVAYSPQKTMCVWLGNSTGQKEFMLEGKNNGGTYCTNIVRDAFANIKIAKDLDFDKPDGIVDAKLDRMNLEKNHTLMLANNLTPERYTTTAQFNQKYLPQSVAEPFEILNYVTIDGKLQNQIAVIEFKTIKTAKYKLFRIEEDTCKMLKEFSNLSGDQQFVDKNTNQDTTYIYYVECLTEEGKTIKSNSIKIKTPAKTNALKKMFDLW